MSRAQTTPSPSAAVVSGQQLTSGVAAAQPAAAANPIAAFFAGLGALLFNQSPTLNPAQRDQNPYGVVTGSLNAVDPDSAPLTYSVLTAPQLGTVTVTADGDYSFVPDPVAAREGFVDSFVVEVSDAETGFHFHGLMSLLNVLTFGLVGRDPHRTTATVAVTVSPVNFVPTATVVVGDPDPSTGVVAGTVLGEDGDGDPLTYTGSGATPKGAVVVGSGGGFSYTPTAQARHAAASLVATDADRADTFAVTVSDGYGGSTAVSVTVAIAPANTAPTGSAVVGVPDAVTGVVAGTVLGVDADGDPLTYSAPGSVAKGTVVVGSGGAFSYTPTAQARHAAASLVATDADRADTFAVTVSDGYGGSTAVSVTVAIAPANVAPVATFTAGVPDAVTGVVAGTVLGVDSDGDALTYTGSGATPKGSVVVGSGGGFSYTPTAQARHAAASLVATDADRADTFTVTVIDGYGGVVDVAVTVAVAPGNTAPTGSVVVGVPDAVTGVVAGTVLGVDADGDALTYSGSGATPKGSVVVGSGGGFSYTPTAQARHAAASLVATDADRADTFAVTVSDGYGGSTAVPVTVAIAPANVAPVATFTAGVPDAVTGVVAGTVLGVDADGDLLTYAGPGATAKGTLSIAPDGTFTYTPNALARHNAAFQSDTADSFSVIVTDGYGGSTAVPVSVIVSPASVEFDFVYGSGSEYWSAAARSALETSATRLSSYIVAGRPVVITYSVVGQNDPGSNFLASNFTTFTGSGAGHYGTVVQAKILTGVDANGSATDSRITWNFAYPWALGDAVPGNQYDFQSVAMHEMAHSLGILSGISSPSSNDRNWTTYDSFLSTADGTAVINADYTWNPAYVANLTGAGGGLYFDGPNAVAAYGGLVPLFTPNPWESGTSVVHFDPDGAVAGQTYLMSPYYDRGAGVRTLSPVEMGMLTDLGYTVVSPSGVYAVFFFISLGFLRRRLRAA